LLFLVSCEDLFDFTRPVVRIIAPRDSASVFGSTPITVTATDNRAVAHVEVDMNDSVLRYVPGDSLSMILNLRDTGWCNVIARAADRHGNVGTAFVSIRNLGPTRPFFLGALVVVDSATDLDTVDIAARAVDPESGNVDLKFFYDVRVDTGWNSGWFGPFHSGAPVHRLVHYGIPGTYTIAALARDARGAVSDTSPVSVLKVYHAPPTSGPLFTSWYAHFLYSPAVQYIPPTANVRKSTLMDSPDSRSLAFIGGSYQSEAGAAAIYATTDADSVYCFLDTGGAEPVVKMGQLGGGRAACAGAPVISTDGQRIYVPYDDGWLYCASADNLGQLYVYAPDTTRYEFCEPAVNGNYLYAGREDGLLYALIDDGSALRLNWTFNAKAPINLSAVISRDGSRLFFGNDSGLYCVDATGKRLWRNPLGGDVTSIAAIAGDGTVYVGCEDSYLYGVNPNTGQTVYQSDPGSGNVVGSPVIAADGTIYAVRDDGEVFCVQSGATIWWTDLPNANDQVSCAPCLAPDSTLIVHSDAENVYALSLRDGHVVWQYALPSQKKLRTSQRRRADSAGLRSPVFGRFATDVSSSPVVGPGNRRIYVGVNAGTEFYDIVVDDNSYDAGLPVAPWPKYQHDYANDGWAGGK
jgi:outer membrane protein assembly factor BamB